MECVCLGENRSRIKIHDGGIVKDPYFKSLIKEKDLYEEYFTYDEEIGAYLILYPEL